MPVYSRDTLKSEKLPWVDIDDFEFFYFNRPTATPAHVTAAAQAAGHTPVWGMPGAPGASGG
jgi:hypothetical protein